jgi:hypothetical protein
MYEVYNYILQSIGQQPFYDKDALYRTGRSHLIIGKLYVTLLQVLVINT